MRRLTLEATNENILNSIRDNTYNRDTDIKDFIETLDKIEGNMFISLDARWGEGKTFFIRQIEKSLEFLTKRNWGKDKSKDVEHLNQYFQHTAINSININQSYLPIYYNAWLYDNHDDPIMSLMLTVVKTADKYLNTDISVSVGEKIKSLLLTGANIICNANFEDVKSKFEGKDILENVKTAEEIREIVKDILDKVIVEEAQRLVIFIDELDRCRPSFAIEMLERIKHYFEDERVIFIVSVNKEQLVHTISKYYGYGFDSTGYLNKFFDLNAHMPVMIESCRKNDLFASGPNNQIHFMQIADGLNEYYKLSLRDSLIFKQRLLDISTKYVKDTTAQGCCLSLFVPLLLILDIKDQEEKIKFINGDSDILFNLNEEVYAIQRMVSRFGKQGIEDKLYSGFERVEATYRYTFKDEDGEYNKNVLDVSSELKRICIKVCNGVTN